MNEVLLEVRETAVFTQWVFGLADERARTRIDTRIARLRYGLFGDSKSIGGGVSELRVDYGPGYRLYFTRRGNKVVILLCGGDKQSQKRNIAAAKQIAADLE